MFAIEYPEGFWSRTKQKYLKDLAQLVPQDLYHWDDFENVVSEAMDEVAVTKDRWFKIVCVTPIHQE